MTKRHRQSINLRSACAIVFVRVTNSSGSNADQDFTWTNLRNWNLRILERLARLHQSNSSHLQSLSPVTTPIRIGLARNDFYFFSAAPGAGEVAGAAGRSEFQISV